MSTQSKKPTAYTPSSAYRRMTPVWDKIDTLLGGTKAMREAGKEYLPQYANESQDNYRTRLDRAVLLNRLEQTLNALTGKPFKEAIGFDEDVPTSILELLDNIDLQGHDLQAFARAWFRESWAKGFSHVLIEHSSPQVRVDEQGNEIARSLADDRAENLRPYWVHINPQNIIAAYSETIAGKEVLTHVRILETSTERVGWEEVQKIRVRVLEPGYWAVYMPEDPKKLDGEWIIEDEGNTALSYIPLVTFYTAKPTGLFECKPPLADLADLNIAHWQSSSDQQNVLTVARFPILAAAGVPPEQEVSIGPNKFLTTEQADGKWYYVEHTGAAIEAGFKDLDALDEQMATYGAEYLRKKPGTETATGRALDSAEAVSYLGATVRDFKDCLEQALQFTADWLNEPTGGSVLMESDLGLAEVDSAELDVLQKSRAQRDLSRKSYLKELKRRKVVADDFDEEEDAEFLEEESAGTAGMAGMLNAPASPVTAEDEE